MSPEAPRSVSVIVTAMNEEGNLAPTVENVVAAVEPRFPDYEVLIIEDGSADATPEIAARLAAANPRIRVHRNRTNKGLAYSLRKGIELADRPHIAWVAANNIVPRKGLEDIYDRVNAADVVLGYVITDVRGVLRRAISRTFTTSVNLLFGLRLRYYTGPWICRAARMKGLETIGQGSMIVPEIPVRLIYGGATYLEVGLQPQSRTAGKTKTFRPSNFVFAATSMARLFWSLRVAGAKPKHQGRHSTD
jgi:glycosyltransferase involved in cell wall biosynthesis